MSGINRRPIDKEEEYARLIRETTAEFPDFTVQAKANSRLMRAIDRLLRIITFGLMTRFMRYTTTIGTTVYVPSDWWSKEPLDRATTLRHERVHMRQKENLGWLFIPIYLFLPFPVIFALGRRNLEMEGYAESLRAHAEYFGMFLLYDKGLKERIVSQFLGPSYFWAWPFRRSVERWYDRTVAEINRSIR